MSNLEKAEALIADAEKRVKAGDLAGARVVLQVAQTRAGMEQAAQARNIAEALVLLLEPSGRPGYRERVEGLWGRLVWADSGGVDPAGNLAQLMDEVNEERAVRHAMSEEEK